MKGSKNKSEISAFMGKQVELKRIKTVGYNVLPNYPKDFSDKASFSS